MQPIFHSVSSALHAFAPSAAASLIAAAWQGAMLASLVAVAMRLLPNLSAEVRFAIWTAVLALVALLPFVHFPGTGASASPTPFHVAEVWSLGLISLWAALSLVRTVQLLRSALHLRSLSRRATSVAIDPQLAPLLRTDRRSAQLCLSTEVDRPSVAGFFSPRILLPASLLPKLSRTELEQILLHEMEHLKRGDDWVNLAQKLSLALFPLNPALFWIERRLCLERELACDDGVLRATGSRKAYATCLASLAEHSLARRTASLALAAWERQSELARRVHRILFHPERTMGRVQTGVALSALGVATLAGAGALAHGPQLVSFAPVAHATLQAQAALPNPVLRPVTAPLMAKTIAHATLAEAIMPGRKPGAATPAFRSVPAVASSHPTPRSATVQRIAQVRRQPEQSNVAAQIREVSQRDDAPPATWIVFSRWEVVRIPAHAAADYDPSGAQPAPQSVSQPTYAAVPTPNGWLVFQL